MSKLRSNKLSFVNTYCYLGVDFDQNLTMSGHLDKVIKKTKPLLYMLGKLRFYVDEETVVQIYKTYVLPVIESGIFVLDGYYKHQVSRLQKLQNKALRLCFKKGNMCRFFPLHVKARLLSLDLRRRYHFLIFINMKLIKNEETFLFSSRQDNRTRGGSKLESNFPHTE